MSGIYIHIPFCKTQCHYCDFYKTVSLSAKKEFLPALEKEIISRKREIGNEVIGSIYFGGGTPSLLEISEIEKLLILLSDNFSLENDTEITLEANPDDINTGYLGALKKIGINRLSIGIQSFDDKDLRMINRRHDSKQAIDSVKKAKDAGFDNLSIDLLYGLPEQSIGKWRTNLEQAVLLNVAHISAYHLTYHEGTVLNEYLRKGKIKELPEGLSLEQFKLLKEVLENGGYEHYEISNFARGGLYSRHNCSYWNGNKYFGFGPAAHSYDEQTRRWNVSNLDRYLLAVKNDKVWWQAEVLSPEDRYNDYIITTLRTKWGINHAYLELTFEDKIVGYFLNQAQSYLDSGHLYFENGIFRLSDSGLFISDKIMESLFYLNN